MSRLKLSLLFIYGNCSRYAEYSTNTIGQQDGEIQAGEAGMVNRGNRDYYQSIKRIARELQCTLSKASKLSLERERISLL